MKKIKLSLNYAGFCFANGKHVVRGDSKKDIKFHALFGLIYHPEKSWILFDTGYTERFYDVTKTYPNKIYAHATKVVVTQDCEIKNQLQQIGLSPSDIKHVIISHFHADHIGGLKDFNEATMYCSKVAYNDVLKSNDFFAFSKGLLKDLIPFDFNQRLVFIEDIATIKTDNIFDFSYDLFNDDSILVYNLPGHAAGQIGIYIETQKNNYFLVSDSCWDERAYKFMLLPNPIVKLFFDSWDDYKSTLIKLSEFSFSCPNVLIVPTHCSKTTSRLVSDKIDMNVL